MAKIIENEKGLKVIEMNLIEAMTCFSNCCPVCDNCNTAIPNKGYYIAVLNEYFCEKCYKKWLKRAKRYEEDIPIENKNFEFYREILEKAGRLFKKPITTVKFTLPQGNCFKAEYY